MNPGDEKLRRFVRLLEDIFELDKADLDFGVYRIMNIRRDEVKKFLAEGLPKKVREAIAPIAAAGDAATAERMAEIEKQARELEVEIAAIPELAEEYSWLKTRKALGLELQALETDAYSALYSFFVRYYDEGDFISKRRYKEGVYALPYEGEEVKLHWANADQYYIKTAENFRDYTFFSDGKKIHFRLLAATAERDNNKEAEGSKRAFMLYAEASDMPEAKAIEEVDGELVIHFVYDVPPDKTVKHDERNFAIILDAIEKRFGAWRHLLALAKPANKETGGATVLEKHLKAYTAKNTFDYFIHKDLRRFLARELDFFIKNEVVHLDDIDTADEKRYDGQLAKVRAIRRVGGAIIDFLAQLEDFQKKSCGSKRSSSSRPTGASRWTGCARTFTRR
jgi:adenine-specific DNA-methyltransferase